MFETKIDTCNVNNNLIESNLTSNKKIENKLLNELNKSAKEYKDSQKTPADIQALLKSLNELRKNNSEIQTLLDEANLKLESDCGFVNTPEFVTRVLATIDQFLEKNSKDIDIFSTKVEINNDKPTNYKNDIIRDIIQNSDIKNNNFIGNSFKAANLLVLHKVELGAEGVELAKTLIENCSNLPSIPNFLVSAKLLITYKDQLKDDFITLRNTLINNSRQHLCPEEFMFTTLMAGKLLDLDENSIKVISEFNSGLSMSIGFINRSLSTFEKVLGDEFQTFIGTENNKNSCYNSLVEMLFGEYKNDIDFKTCLNTLIEQYNDSNNDYKNDILKNILIDQYNSMIDSYKNDIIQNSDIKNSNFISNSAKAANLLVLHKAELGADGVELAKTLIENCNNLPIPNFLVSAELLVEYKDQLKDNFITLRETLIEKISNIDKKDIIQALPLLIKLINAEPINNIKLVDTIQKLITLMEIYNHTGETIIADQIELLLLKYKVQLADQAEILVKSYLEKFKKDADQAEILVKSYLEKFKKENTNNIAITKPNSIIQRRLFCGSLYKLPWLLQVYKNELGDAATIVVETIIKNVLNRNVEIFEKIDYTVYLEMVESLLKSYQKNLSPGFKKSLEPLIESFRKSL